ncbi:MAG: hypothetical protein KTR25_08930 [Myxococcales bacterium]|nr:hypothetical protein [Myxococcales bacterium]
MVLVSKFGLPTTEQKLAQSLLHHSGVKFDRVVSAAHANVISSFNTVESPHIDELRALDTHTHIFPPSAYDAMVLEQALQRFFPSHPDLLRLHPPLKRVCHAQGFQVHLQQIAARCAQTPSTSSTYIMGTLLIKLVVAQDRIHQQRLEDGAWS